MNSGNKVLMSGNEAVARGAWEAGVVVSTSYPGTPATEINEAFSDYKEVKAEWSVNEKVALEVAYGASLAGVRAIAIMKQVGVNVAADPLFSSVYAGVNGGLVIITADEPGLHSSQNEQDNRYYAKNAQIPMLEPSNSQEAKDFTKLAFEISEQHDIPVFVRMTTRICHTKDTVVLSPREERARKPYVKNIQKFAMVPSHAMSRHFDLEKRQIRLEAYSNTFEGNLIEMRSLEIGAVTSGISYYNTREALPECSTLKIGMTYPLPHQLIRNFASQVKYLYVVEENQPFLEEEIMALGIKVEGKEKLLRVGELSATTLRRRILHEGSGQKGCVENLPKRPPQFCPGCGHRGFFNIAKKLKLVVTGDIGCYGLGAVPPYDAIDSLICMGGGITMAHGFDKIAEHSKEKVIGVVGDSTFFHSGLTGIANIVFNKGFSTIVILDNATTAMTGHQPNPAAGYGFNNSPAPKISIEDVCRSLGVEHVRTVDAYDMKSMEEALKEEVESKTSSVIVIRGPCALMERKPRAPYGVTEQCIKCKRCFQVGCPAITLEADKVKIQQFLCYGCGVCSSVCPKNAIVRKDSKKKE